MTTLLTGLADAITPLTGMGGSGAHISSDAEQSSVNAQTSFVHSRCGEPVLPPASEQAVRQLLHFTACCNTLYCSASRAAQHHSVQDSTKARAELDTQKWAHFLCINQALALSRKVLAA
jgi:hypothetical protein